MADATVNKIADADALYDVGRVVAAMASTSSSTASTGARQAERAEIAAGRAQAEAIHDEMDLREALADIDDRIDALTAELGMAELEMTGRLDTVAQLRALIAPIDVEIGDLEQALMDFAQVEQPDQMVRAMAFVRREDLQAAHGRRGPLLDQLGMGERDARATAAQIADLREQIGRLETKRADPLNCDDIEAALVRMVRIWPQTLLAARAGVDVPPNKTAMATIVGTLVMNATGLGDRVVVAAQSEARRVFDNTRRELGR